MKFNLFLIYNLIIVVQNQFVDYEYIQVFKDLSSAKKFTQFNSEDLLLIDSSSSSDSLKSKELEELRDIKLRRFDQLNSYKNKLEDCRNDYQKKIATIKDKIHTAFIIELKDKCKILNIDLPDTSEVLELKSEQSAAKSKADGLFKKADGLYQESERIKRLLDSEDKKLDPKIKLFKNFVVSLKQDIKETDSDSVLNNLLSEFANITEEDIEDFKCEVIPIVVTAKVLETEYNSFKKEKGLEKLLSDLRSLVILKLNQADSIDLSLADIDKPCTSTGTSTCNFKNDKDKVKSKLGKIVEKNELLKAASDALNKKIDFKYDIKPSSESYKSIYSNKLDTKRRDIKSDRQQIINGINSLKLKIQSEKDRFTKETCKTGLRQNLNLFNSKKYRFIIMAGLSKIFLNKKFEIVNYDAIKLEIENEMIKNCQNFLDSLKNKFETDFYDKLKPDIKLLQEYEKRNLELTKIKYELSSKIVKLNTFNLEKSLNVDSISDIKQGEDLTQQLNKYNSKIKEIMDKLTLKKDYNNLKLLKNHLYSKDDLIGKSIDLVLNEIKEGFKLKFNNYEKEIKHKNKRQSTLMSHKVLEFKSDIIKYFKNLNDQFDLTFNNYILNLEREKNQMIEAYKVSIIDDEIY